MENPIDKIDENQGVALVLGNLHIRNIHGIWVSIRVDN